MRKSAFVPLRRLLSLTVVLAALGVALPSPAYKGPKESALEDFKFDPSRGPKPWQELQAMLPAYPREENLLPVRMPVSYTLKIFLDEKSVSLAEDDIARFTLVVESSSGYRNIFYEGIRCETREYKTYAYGAPEGEFHLLKEPKWQKIPYYDINAYRYQLARNYVCDPELSLSMALPPQKLVRRVREAAFK